MAGTKKTKKPAPEKEPKTTGEETVAVPVSELKMIREALESSREKEQQRDREIAILKKAAMRSRYEQAESSMDDPSVDKRPQYHLKAMNFAYEKEGERVVEERIIAKRFNKDESPHVVENGVNRIGNNFAGETVKMHLSFLPKKGETETLEKIIDMSAYNAIDKRIPVREVSRNIKDGDITLTLQFEDPELDETYGEFELNIKYVN